MTNAKEEFLHAVLDRPAVKCASIIFGCEDYPEYDENDNIIEVDPYKSHILLPVNYTPEQFQQFLKDIDRNYDSGYGGQELFGIIWLIDGTWLDRGEYDGSEWWSYQCCPIIPDKLL
jgi:hypothetical protein